jgi:hypothetical protein
MTEAEAKKVLDRLYKQAAKVLLPLMVEQILEALKRSGAIR